MDIEDFTDFIRFSINRTVNEMQNKKPNLAYLSLVQIKGVLTEMVTSQGKPVSQDEMLTVECCCK